MAVTVKGVTTVKGSTTVGFSPASLFAAGEQGVWYDPSDLSTLFQDSAGTTPVTAVEQVVGLMLDKRGSRGAELVTNGTFASNFTGWTQYASANGSVVGGEFYIISGSSGGDGYWQDLSGLSASKTYIVTGTFRAGTGTAFVSVRQGTGSFGTTLNQQQTTATTATSYSFIFTGQTGVRVYLGATNTGQSGYFDNISVREIPGNHATASGTARPTLSARVNLFTKTQEFDDAAWTKGNITVSANAATAPDGTLTADLIYPTTTGTARAVSQAKTGQVNGATYTVSVYLKSAGKTFAYLYNVQGNQLFYVNLTTGATSNVGTNISNIVTSVRSDGWVFVSFTSVITVGTTADPYFGPCDAAGSTTATTSGTDGIYIWGADLRPANAGVGLPVYQRVNTSTDYDTVGFPYYLAFNGSTTTMVSSSIVYAPSDKATVWAGVRKLSDASTGHVVESGTGAAAGSFYLAAPNTVLVVPYLWTPKGTTSNIFTNPASGYAAPITNVVTGTMDIANDSSVLRLNGSQVATNSADQGTGTLGPWPLYIGSRAGTMNWFNGNLYSLIVRGASSSAEQIAATEAYVNQRTRAY